MKPGPRLRGPIGGGRIHLALEGPFALDNGTGVESFAEIELLRVFVVQYGGRIAAHQDFSREDDVAAIGNGECFPFTMVG